VAVIEIQANVGIVNLRETSGNKMYNPICIKCNEQMNNKEYGFVLSHFNLVTQKRCGYSATLFECSSCGNQIVANVGLTIFDLTNYTGTILANMSEEY